MTGRTTYTVDCRDVFTIHETGCAHLRLAGDTTYDFDAPVAASKQEIQAAALTAFNGGDEDEGVEFAFAPCVEANR